MIKRQFIDGEVDHQIGTSGARRPRGPRAAGRHRHRRPDQARRRDLVRPARRGRPPARRPRRGGPRHRHPRARRPSSRPPVPRTPLPAPDPRPGAPRKADPMPDGIMLAHRPAAPGGLRRSSCSSARCAIVPQQTALIIERLGRYSRTLEARPAPPRAVRRPRARQHRPARAGRLLPAAAGHHERQPRREHRHGHLLPGHRPEVGGLRDRQLHPGHRAAHRHHAAQRHRLARPRADADQPRPDQRPAARGARRGDRQVGHPRQPRRAQGDRPAALASRSRWRSR